MSIPTPPDGDSKEAARLEAFAAYLESASGISWRHGLFPPNEIDVVVGTIRPYTEVAPISTSDATTAEQYQLQVQCRTADMDLVSAIATMKSWQWFIANKLNELRKMGTSGTFRGIALSDALQGISPGSLLGSRSSGWTQIQAELGDNRTDIDQGTVVVKLLMNYEIPGGHVEMEKEWW